MIPTSCLSFLEWSASSPSSFGLLLRSTGASPQFFESFVCSRSEARSSKIPVSEIRYGLRFSLIVCADAVDLFAGSAVFFLRDSWNFGGQFSSDRTLLSSGGDRPIRRIDRETGRRPDRDGTRRISSLNSRRRPLKRGGDGGRFWEDFQADRGSPIPEGRVVAKMKKVGTYRTRRRFKA